VQNKILNSEPGYLATASLSSLGANVLNCSVTTLTPGGIGFTGTQPYVILKHVRLQNQLTTTSVYATLYKGATLASVAGTEFAFSSVSIPAQSYVDWYGQHRFDSGDYLTGFCNLQQAVIINMDGEIGLS
jgi:hypothetical protein